ncbi:AraC family transcriptional regulator [Pelagicoccus sp. SDUM812002]|uniref:AraC family transcriptional regulator n=1 Tax=Pelagicoccus sp. SDUM812002 TaxID=3041266 RepID=UPI0028105681|nr:AraC family transcriptional regulator [Pelagicoccus sp. SDUM812002]MDQ8187117.1 AraC family transcriptional regulator [Pelagicoccus sp. SDUM812002]
MSPPEYPHRLHPPSDLYPTWQGDINQPLVYLGWGERNFAREAIPMHSNPGWTYWILLEGAVTLQNPQGTQNFQAGEGMLCGPALPFGFPIQKATGVKVLNWIWSEAPLSETQLAKDFYQTFSFSKDQTRLLAALHEQSRISTLDTSKQNRIELFHIRSLLDLTFQKAGETQNSSPGQNRIRAARQWMLHNLNKTNPASSLARFLDTSPMTLHRLFMNELGESPGSHFQKLKMDHARHLLKLEGHSVKSVAYEMGYRHPQDFSRAYKKHHGSAPSR